MEKISKRPRVREIQIRWLKEDLSPDPKKDLPTRFQKALNRNGAHHTTTVRAMIKAYVEITEGESSSVERAARSSIPKK
jgi:hypothetical protein